MPFRHPIVRGLIAAIIILAILPLNAAYAQEGTEGTPTEASGTLLVTAALCSEGGEPGTVLFALDSGIASGATCAPADIAISIDGAEAVGVSGSGVFSLPEGTHTVTDIETGQSLAVDIFADTQTAIERVAFAAVQIAEVPTDTPVPTETATATPPVAAIPGQITITMHLCPSTIANRDGFDALGGFDQQMAACPSILLPGNSPVPGTTGGSAASFDLNMATGAADTAENQTLANSIFTPGSRCETDAGFDLDSDGLLATCFDLSGYALDYAAIGAVTISLGPLPPDSRLGAVGFIPGSGDELTLKRTSKEGVIELDTTGDDAVSLNVFLFSTARADTGSRNRDGDAQTDKDANADSRNSNGNTQTDKDADAGSRNRDGNTQTHADANAGSSRIGHAASDGAFLHSRYRCDIAECASSRTGGRRRRSRRFNVRWRQRIVRSLSQRQLRRFNQHRCEWRQFDERTGSGELHHNEPKKWRIFRCEHCQWHDHPRNSALLCRRRRR